MINIPYSQCAEDIYWCWGCFSFSLTPPPPQYLKEKKKKLKKIASSSQLSAYSWSMLYTSDENHWGERTPLDDLCPTPTPMHQLHVPQPNVINGVLFLTSFSKSSIWCMANPILADGRWCNIDWWLKKAIGCGMPHHWHGTKCCRDCTICQHSFLTASAQGWPSLNWYFPKKERGEKTQIETSIVFSSSSWLL